MRFRIHHDHQQQACVFFSHPDDARSFEEWSIQKGLDAEHIGMYVYVRSMPRNAPYNTLTSPELGVCLALWEIETR